MNGFSFGSLVAEVTIKLREKGSLLIIRPIVQIGISFIIIYFALVTKQKRADHEITEI